ncbi:cyclic GMP-AMP synthase-like receptor [Cylas formicarius]|uniref:cyclic GMP-AMP synthase-like receptor n=1 Tax=Cylas formicarius TaxID=197179 RepID=UPI00295840D2|nr:cyclic GMP-AMP synthase-like receptor [Cylas formicarius]
MNWPDKKRYTLMENVLNGINSKHISLPESETKRNTKILEKLTSTILDHMKQKDVLFGAMFEKNFYGGSYYDNLKVGNPNEFDLDFVMNVPLVVEPKLSCSVHPGFVKVQISAFKKLETRAEKPKYEKLPTLLDQGNYLCINKVLVWIERVLILALKELPQDETGHYVEVVVGEDETIKVYAKMSKGPPAFTMKMFGKDRNGDIQLDIDLVPCFQFTDDKWPDPSQGYRKNPSQTKKKFLIVPKKPKVEGRENDAKLERYWRLSFQEQERELISGSHLKVLKPTIRLLKKLRDRQLHKIASYYIKTLFLWALETEPPVLWAQPLSYVFMMMLKIYAAKMKDGVIPYYWNRKHNLIDSLKEPTRNDIANALRNIIDEVEWQLGEPHLNPFIIGKYLLSAVDYEQLPSSVIVSKKLAKSKVNASSDSPDSSRTKIKLTAEEAEQVKLCSEQYDKARNELRELSAQPAEDGFQIALLQRLAKMDEKMEDMKGEIEDLRNENIKLADRCDALTDKTILLESMLNNLGS